MKIIRIVLFLLLPTSLLAQTNKGLKLYAVLGSQFNHLHSDFDTKIDGSLSSFALGAGSSYYFANLFLGTEFYFSNGSKSNEINKLDYSGLNTTINVGYNVLKSTKFQLEPQIGFLMSNNKYLKGDLKTNNTEYFTKNNLGITPAVAFNYVNNAGVLYGVKIGYNQTFNQKENWKAGINKTASTYSAHTNAFFVQVNIGGILSSKKKQVK
ncbi:hypothetical protein [Pedobacter sp. MW01-1-1]|uniref:hypothetical protein n=1 Tax=Pedobacter sp. MW01-1-1 TaxID=3383027 RepID=UPI003FEEE7CC